MSIVTPIKNDEWTTAIELLGYENFALQTLNLITEADPPFTLTISGRWGAGKTSMLKTLMHCLGGNPLQSEMASFFHNETFPELSSALLKSWIEQKKDSHSKYTTKCVWFNPWQFQHDLNPVIPLLHEIRAQLGGEKKVLDKDSTVQVYAEAGMQGIANLADTAMQMIGFSRFGAFSTITKTLKESNEARLKDNFLHPLDSQRFYLHFEAAIKLLVSPKADNEGRLVIFIDDLDRCSNEVVFALLESIKLYLSSRYCVFVFGLDRVHVEQAVEVAGKYTPQEAAQYVEKLFQVNLILPKPIITDLFKEKFFAGIEYLQSDLVDMLPANPRAIKNFLNGFRHYRNFYYNGGTPEQKRDERLILVHLLRYFFPDAYELLQQFSSDVLVDLLQVMRGETDFNNQRQAYLHHILENPLLHSTSSSPMDKDRFRIVRVGAWKSKSMNVFFEKFANTFHNNPDLLSQYLDNTSR
ncbi:MAG: KAP family NTPase [Magnetococcus sp. DMHC-6]